MQSSGSCRFGEAFNPNYQLQPWKSPLFVDSSEATRAALELAVNTKKLNLAESVDAAEKMMIKRLCFTLGGVAAMRFPLEPNIPAESFLQKISGQRPAAR